MRSLLRNKVKFYYALYETQNEIIDEYGNKTGQYAITYSKPVEMWGNISPSVGAIENRQFGDSESYDKVIVLDKRDIPINEYSLLWVDTLPIFNEKGLTETPHDYIVKKVARSLNSVSLAIRKVDVNG